MEIKDLSDKLVAVLGFGVEGRAVTNYLLKNGIKPVLFDQKPWEEWTPKEQQGIKALKINFVFGPDCFKELAGFNIAFRSPGISPAQPDLALRIKRKSLIITSQTKWFFEHCPSQIIGITGTKGKGTTSALVYEMLKSKPPNLKSKIFLTGNIGKTQPLEILDELKKDDWVVYELSSFQLQDLQQSPHIAVVLMVTSEHLDYHKDQADYVNAKTAITKYQTARDVAVINADFNNSLKIGKLGEGIKKYFSRKKRKLDCYVENGWVYLKTDPGNYQPIINTQNLKLRGAHNWENICAAALAASSAGVSEKAIARAAIKFKGLEHRLEFATEKHGIKFYNDSFSTTPETAIAAINSFTEPEVLILGGSSKKSDFTELVKTIKSAPNIKTIIAIDKEGLKLRQLLKQSGFSGQIQNGARNMKEIFSQIKQVAAKGDVVLLSPACASFGLFKNYKDRGEQFKRWAKSF